MYQPTSLPAIQSSKPESSSHTKLLLGNFKILASYFCRPTCCPETCSDARSQKCLICHIDGESLTHTRPMSRVEGRESMYLAWISCVVVAPRISVRSGTKLCLRLWKFSPR